MSAMTDAIAAHRAAWQAFQDAPEGEKGTEQYEAAAMAECAMDMLAYDLVWTIPLDTTDVSALRTHLDWFTTEEVENAGSYRELFALHATIDMGLCTRCDIRAKERSMKLVENGKIITRRDLVSRLEKVQRALGVQAQRADAAERENRELRILLAAVREARP